MSPSSEQSPHPGKDDLFFMIRKKWLTLVKVVDQVEHAARNKCLEHTLLPDLRQ